MNAEAAGDRVVVRIPRAELERRWALLRDYMHEQQVEAVVAYSSEDFLGGYVRWLTDRPAYYAYGTVAVFHRDDLMSIVEHGFLGTRRAINDRDPDYPGVGEVYQTSAFHSVNYTNGYEAEIVAKIIRQRGYRRVAFAGAGGMTHGFVAKLTALSQIAFADVTGFLDEARAVKSDAERHEIRATAAMQDRVFGKVLDMVRPGIRDADIMAVVQAEGRHEGSEQGVIMVGSSPPGEPAIMRHPRFQNRRIAKGDSVTLLIENNGAAGYYTELGRVIILGRASQAAIDANAAVIEAQAETVKRLIPGAGCAEIAKAHDAHMVARGLPPETRLYAHGQGYSLVERPLVRADETMVVKAGMNLVVHPAYATANVFGFICDNYEIPPAGLASRLHRTEQKLFEVEG